MGPAILPGLVGVACLVGWLLLWAYAKLTGSESAVRLRKVLVTAAAAVAIVSGILVASEIILGRVPSRVFNQSFGFEPTPDVTELQGYSFGLFDSGEAYLRFRASQDTINRIVKSKFRPSSKESFGNGTSGEGERPPEYWKPFETQPSQFYESNKLEMGYSQSRALLCYDDKTGTAHFSYSGVD